jgi:glycosyltransferase involved in cell wall biosynthesis
VREEIRAARAMVLPSFAEGLPMVIMEAFALSRPVISTYVAGIPELVDADCGWLVPAGSVEPLVDAMKRALDTPIAQLERMGRAGQTKVHERHHIDIEAAKLRAVLERSLGSRLGASAGTSQREGAPIGAIGSRRPDVSSG